MSRVRALLSVCFAVACEASPQPLPPPVIEQQGLELNPAPTPANVVLSGAPGTVRDADRVLLVNLGPGGTFDPVQVDVAADGGFALELPGAVTDAFRVHALRGANERSDPLDVTGTAAGGPVVPAFRHACVVSDPDPELEIEAAALSTSSRVIGIDNQCASPLIITNATIAPTQGWSATITGSPDVPAGAQSTIEVVFGTDQPELRIGVLRTSLDVAGEIELRATTLFGTSR